MRVTLKARFYSRVGVEAADSSDSDYIPAHPEGSESTPNTTINVSKK
jgi:hypothetical protein